MAISAQHFVEFTRHSVSGPSQLCWTLLRGGIARLLPVLFALWTRLPELLHILRSKVRILENQSLYIGLEKSADSTETSNDLDDCLVTCEVLYDPQNEREMDIIFIHGLHGSTVKTWRQGDWNYKYQEVRRISLRKDDSTTSVNQGVCPHCHLVKQQTRKSFCNLNDVEKTRTDFTMRSHSVPNAVYRHSDNSIPYNVNIYEVENENSDDTEEDILSFVVGDHKEENVHNDQLINNQRDAEKPNMGDGLCFRIKEDQSTNDDIVDECDIRNKIGDNVTCIREMKEFDSLVNTCDINFLKDYITKSVHNIRGMCDICSKKCQNDFANECDKCLRIERLLIDNISTSDSTALPTNVDYPLYDENRIRSTVKRKYNKVDIGNDIHSKLLHNDSLNRKVRKVDTIDLSEEIISMEYAYWDMDEQLHDFIGVNSGMINIHNDELNTLSIQLSDDLDTNENIFHAINKDEESLSNTQGCEDILPDGTRSSEEITKDEGDIRTHFCTCDRNSSSDTIKMEREYPKVESLSNCWPKDWLPLDYPNARIISLSYTTDQNLWRPIWIKPYNRSSLKDRSYEMVHKLAALGVGEKPIIWVGHSKGGLFIKEIFSTGFESSTSHEEPTDFDAIYKNTKALVLYSVPHRGSPLANITFPPLLRVSSELEEIQHESEFVLKLHERFISALEKGNVDPAILSYSETRRTLMGAFYLRIVSTHSADPGVGHMYYGLSLDHREICKPTSRSCFLYKELLCIIEHIQKSIVEEDF